MNANVRRQKHLSFLWFVIFFVVYLIVVFSMTGCAMGSFNLVRPGTKITTTSPDGTITVTEIEGATVTANAFAWFRDTGLERFKYDVKEQHRGSGLMAETESRSATVGAEGYTGTTKVEALKALLDEIIKP